METKRVLIVMGSRSDLPSMEGCMKQLDDFQVGYEVRVLSAHRTPEAVLELSKTACERGIQVIIAAAGGAAHLAGVLASSTPLPVIGIPIQTSALGGLDSLLSTETNASRCSCCDCRNWKIRGKKCSYFSLPDDWTK